MRAGVQNVAKHTSSKLSGAGQIQRWQIGAQCMVSGSWVGNARGSCSAAWLCCSVHSAWQQDGSFSKAAQLLHDSVQQDRQSLYMAWGAPLHALGLLPWL